MRYKLLLLSIICFVFLLVFLTGNSKTNTKDYSLSDKIKTLNVGNKDIVFSDIAKRGKVSLFIISAHWCGPCKALKNKLSDAFKAKLISPKDVDIYYCLVSKDNNDTPDKMEKKSGYRHLKYIDQLTEVFPTTIILTPTRNCYTIVKGANYDVIMGTINDLLTIKKNYFDIKEFTSDSNSINQSVTDTIDTE